MLPSSTDKTGTFEVVGIGASAGGLVSIESFFSNIPIQSGKAYVVIQHLSPDFKSLMPEILSRKTSMPIYEVVDQVELKPDNIYLLPHKKNVTITGNKLILFDIDKSVSPNRPIDIFFHSLAQSHGSLATAVILSGSGSDGAKGIKSIHEADGKIYVESPESAKFDGMPEQAIATDTVDFIGTPEEIAKNLTEEAVASVVSENNTKDTNSDLDRYKILQLIQEHYAVDFNSYKLNTVKRRIDHRRGLLGIPTIRKYVRYIDKNPDEIINLYYELLIGVTNFFRDKDAFDNLYRNIIPAIIRKKSDNDEIRVWVTGCASGEEAYSHSILLHEAVQKSKKKLEIKIFA